MTPTLLHLPFIKRTLSLALLLLSCKVLPDSQFRIIHDLAMAPRTINVLLTSFPGLSLPPTLSIPISASAPISDLTSRLADRLPELKTRLILTTSSNKALQASSLAPISSLLSEDHDTILPLRLSVPLCGGKGGFGSQLRAAGGRMSSKKRKTAGDANSSNRNLDGRRLRTVNEAKALAEYLALKPEMERKEKQARRKRWEQVVELAEKRKEDIRSGEKVRVDGRWVEAKEEAGERAREAVKAAMASGIYQDNLTTIRGSKRISREELSDSTSEESDGDGILQAGPSKNPSTSASAVLPTPSSRTYYGFDEDDEFMSDDSEEGPAVGGEKGQRKSMEA